MKISVIGTGAVGGFYGSLLATAGNEVHFLVRSDYEICREKGLLLKSNAFGDIKIYPHDTQEKGAHTKAYFHKNPEELPEDSELVIIAIKSTENDKLSVLLKNFKNHSPIVLLIQNGIGQENLIHIQLPYARRVFGGLAFLCSIKEAPGVVHHIDYGDLTIAESIPGGSGNAMIDEVAESLGRLFRDARVSVTIESDLILSRWQKLVWNIPFNGLSVVLNSNTTEIITHPQSLNLVKDLMKEVQSIARGDGKEISDSFLEERIHRTFRMKPYKPSMKLDYERKKPMELEAIYLDPLLRAEFHRIPAPRIRMLYEELSFLEKKNLDWQG